MNIEFKEDAVCYAGGKQWFFNDSVKPYKLVCNSSGTFLETLEGILSFDDFQLNKPSNGYYIPKSELDTEEKYNQAVEVFGLLGHGVICSFESFSLKLHTLMLINSGGNFVADNKVNSKKPVKLTFDQLMAIGELKRKMNERENLKNVKEWSGVAPDYWETHNIDGTLKNNIKSPSNGRNPKSKEAYRILESQGIEWDNVKLKWFKKEWL